jgi:Family of unknown function (DUF5906)/Bifunctional DNA primase/polymerase, N-terminal
LIQDPAKRFLLGLIHDLASLPLYGLDQLDDLPLDAIAQVVRVHRVEFPTAEAMIVGEPVVARVLALIGGDGVGIVGGGPHCLKFADVDTDDSEINAALDKVFPACTVIKRGEKGSTRFYRGSALPAGKIMWKKDGDKKPVLELLGSRNQTVLPPTQHPSGIQYCWTGDDALGYVAPDELTELPADFLEQVDAVLEPLGYYRPEKAKTKTSSAAEDSAGAARRKLHTWSRPNVWRLLNDDALNRLSEWVPHLGLAHCHHKANGGYEAVADWRPSSSGRSLERRATNLKIDPRGIVDFGDQTYTAIDLVRAAQGCSQQEAFVWLDDRLNTRTVEIDPGEASIVLPDDGADQADGTDEEPYELEDEEIDWDEKGELSDVELKRMRIRAKAERQALIEEFNAKYTVVCEGGQSFVYHLVYNEILRRKFYESMTIGSLSQLYANRKVTTFVTKKGQKKKKQVAPFWNTHKDRRQYIEGVEFDPSRKGHRDGYLNLWQGFGVEAKAGGSWEKLKTHMKMNICSGVIEHYEWLMNWCARMIQHPELQGEVAVVLRGKKGTGKGTFGHALRRLLSHHGIHISTSVHLVGKFNEHLRDCVFMFADEAFFAGDKAGEGTLKTLITENVILVEGKFKTAQPYPNRLHVLMATNSDWAVPASGAWTTRGSAFAGRAGGRSGAGDGSSSARGKRIHSREDVASGTRADECPGFQEGRAVVVGTTGGRWSVKGRSDTGSPFTPQSYRRSVCLTGACHILRVVFQQHDRF